MWKVSPYDDRYLVSDNGCVKGPSGRYLKHVVHKDGYHYVWLGKGNRHAVHRLVLETFEGPCPDGMEACHGDGDRGNNGIENLRWDTRPNNSADKAGHGTQQRGAAVSTSKVTGDVVSSFEKLPRTCQCGCQSELTGRQLKYATENCKKVGNRNAWLLKTYGITQKEYDLILEFQGGVCPLCKRAPRAGEIFHVDHEHRVGQGGPVRGIICAYDNTRIIGRLKSFERAQAMADYLRDPPATRALGREQWADGRPKKKRTYKRRKRK